ncbi:MAG: hypothetical protein ACI9TH_002179 [Kiritimatiellia bacterium]|jgi:hypothetical protein
MNMDEILDKLTEYVSAMSEALVNDGNANDRSLLTKHLAAAAEMFAAASSITVTEAAHMRVMIIRKG